MSEHYRIHKIEPQVIEAIVAKLKAVETDDSIEAYITDIDEGFAHQINKAGNVVKNAHIDVVINDIRFNVDGLTSNNATMTIELLCYDVELEADKIKKCDNYLRFCWDERDEIWDFYAENQDKKEKILLAKYNENGFGFSGDKALAENVKIGVLKELSQDEVDSIALKLMHKAVFMKE